MAQSNQRRQQRSLAPAQPRQTPRHAPPPARRHFSQEAKRESLAKLVHGIMQAIAEGSRYHGYKNSNAPLFLDYRIFKFVDLRDPGKTNGNSSRIPLKPGVTNTFNVNHDHFFSDDFAHHLKVPDPNDASRF